MTTKPAVGRIVLVHHPDLREGERPAVITKVWSDHVVNVAMFGDGSFDDFDVRRITSVQHQDHAGGPLRYRWHTDPPRED